MNIDRRTFFKGALLGGTAAAAGLAGCAPKAEMADTGGSDARDKEREAFEAAAAPIEPASVPENWDEEAEVIVVGSGAAGINAAIRLGQAGYQVLVLERNMELNGNSKHSSVFSNMGGHKAAEERKFAYPEYPYDVDRILEYVMSCQQQTGDPELVRAMLVEGPKCIDWMNEKAGAKWVPMNPSPAGAGMLEWEGMSTPTNGINVNLIPLQLLTEQRRKTGPRCAPTATWTRSFSTVGPSWA